MLALRPYRVVAMLAVAALVAAAIACGDDDDSAPELGDADSTGEELVDEFIVLVRDGNVDGLEGFLSDAFMLQRADGSFATKDEYLSNLTEIGEYEIDDVSAQQDGDALVVHWTLTIEEVIDGQPFATDPAPRLSTFVWSDDRWQLIAHANFNAPEPEGEE